MKHFFPLCFLLLFTISCSRQAVQTSTVTKAWNYSDLRAIDPSDTKTPNIDIIALYSRQLNNNLQIRIDFLDQTIDNYPSLLLLFNNGWEGNSQLPFDILPQSNWNYLLLIPSDGHIILKDQKDEPVDSPKVSIIRDIALGALILNIDKSAISGLSTKTEIELFSADNSFSEIDRLSPIQLGASPPSRGKVVLAFWDIFKADTPAQALRSWDGAHTGPFSSRHGLVSLVESIEKTGIPAFLFDINKTKTWSIFDYLGIDERLKVLIDQGKVIVVDQGSNLSPDLSKLDDETANSFVNDLSGEIPSIAVRRALLTTTQNSENTLLLGGEFNKTAWGDFSTAFQTLSYIKNHPWLEPISDRSLIETQVNPAAENGDSFFDDIEAKIRVVPENRIRTVAEELLSSLSEPGTQMENDLKRVYIGQIGHLLAISKWSANRQPISDCSQNLDSDNDLECILASDNLAVVIDLQGGYISYAFSFHAGEYHQIIGPSYQLAIGLSDPMSWKFDQGISTDPSVIPGAFSGVENKWRKFHLTKVDRDSITIQEEDRLSEKRFRITNASIYFQYKGYNNEKFAIPLILDPWTMETEDWGSLYTNTIQTQRWLWGIENRITVETIFMDHLEVSTFQDSISLIQAPENPSLDYPAGHYLPFPLAFGQLTTEYQGLVEIRLSY
jgi:hypothetical protein